MVKGEGNIEIPLEDFWNFIDKYHEHNIVEIAYGVPFVNKEKQVITLDYAYENEKHPSEWKDKPKCLKQWDGSFNEENRTQFKMYMENLVSTVVNEKAEKDNRVDLIAYQNGMLDLINKLFKDI